MLRSPLVPLAVAGLAALSSAQEHADQPSATAERLLTDFAGDSADRGPTLDFVSVNDTVMGGRSEGDFEIADGQMRFRGTLNTNGGGFTSVRSRPRALELAGFAGVHLRVRGDGREYSVRLQQSGEQSRRQASYGASFSTEDLRGTDRWQEVYVPFDTCTPSWRGQQLDREPIDPARINVVGITLADAVDGPFELDVDRISAFRAFDLERLRETSRVLLLFAKDAADLHLLHQLRSLETVETGCRERDLEVLVLLSDGPSRHGSRRLSNAAVTDLRRQFRVEDDRFVALLIGKDGGEKARENHHLDAEDWFARIDAMPMRQREMRRGPDGVRDGSH